VVTKAAEDRGCGAKEILLALLASRVALSVWIEDGHTSIFAGKAGIQAKTWIL
jgi:hypothetical protein